MTIRPYQHTVPPRTFSTFPDVTAWARQMYDALLKLRRGKVECITEITLTANAATTTLTDERLSNQSVVHFDPKTANAAAELYGGTMYVLTANRVSGAWVITHANNAQTDREFQVSILG